MFPRVTGLSVNELCKAGLDFKDSADNADTDPAPLHLHSVNTSVNRVSLFYCWNTSQQKLNIGLIINGGLTSCSQRISAFLVNLWQWRTDFKKMKVITEKVITHPQTLHPEIYMSSVFVFKPIFLLSYFYRDSSPKSAHHISAHNPGTAHLSILSSCQYLI